MPIRETSSEIVTVNSTPYPAATLRRMGYQVTSRGTSPEFASTAGRLGTVFIACMKAPAGSAFVAVVLIPLMMSRMSDAPGLKGGHNGDRTRSGASDGRST